MAVVDEDDEALGKPAALVAEDAPRGEASGARAAATPGAPTTPAGLAEEEDEDFLAVFSLSNEAAAEA